MDNDSQAMNAARALVKLAWRDGLQPGDRFPTQSELAARTKLCNNTLTPAAIALARSGFLCARGKLGRELADRTRWPHGLWRIGVPYGPPDDRPGGHFAAMLLCFLQSALAENGCLCTGFPLKREYRGVIPHRLDHFSGLAEAVSAGTVDGLITVAFLDNATPGVCPVPIAFIGGNPAFPIRTELDAAPVAAAMAERFHARGVRRPLLAGHQNCDFPGFPEVVCTENVSGLLTAIPSPEVLARYDGIAVMNDLAGVAWSIALARAGLSPVFAVQTNRQLPQSYALPVIRYEFDIQELTRDAVDQLLQCILTGCNATVRPARFTEKSDLP